LSLLVPERATIRTLLTFISDHYFRASAPVLAALNECPKTARELSYIYRAIHPKRQTRLENVLAWLENYGHIEYRQGKWHAKQRLNLDALAKGFSVLYETPKESLKSRSPVGKHVKARGAFCWYCSNHGFTFEELSTFLCLPANLLKNAAQRFESTLEAA
jgi:hypothetical protein